MIIVGVSLLKIANSNAWWILIALGAATVINGGISISQTTASK